MNLVKLMYPVLHTKFQDHRLFCSGEEDFKRFLPYNVYGHGGHLGNVTSPVSVNLGPGPCLMRAQHVSLVALGQKMFEINEISVTKLKEWYM